MLHGTQGGAIVEIGVAQGDTSVFLLEHLKTTGDKRKAYFFDTFSGFTVDAIKYEIGQRGKPQKPYDAFKYGNELSFQKNLQRAGYSNFSIIKGDASIYDWASIAPIAAVLLDIDLYKPTIEILRAIWPHIVEGGGIVVDDCLANTPWDGALQA
jgi:O-methyltransferase